MIDAFQVLFVSAILGSVFLGVVVLETAMEWALTRRQRRDAENEARDRVRRRERGA